MCSYCGKDFTPARSNQRYCSPPCARLADNLNRALRYKNSPSPEDDWLTIPDAPNYEVNGQCVVRSKKHDRPLKICRGQYHIKDAHGVQIGRKGDTFRWQAEAAAGKTEWASIPSLPNYEIDARGTLRNAKTKRPLKLLHGKYYVFNNGKYTFRSREQLLYEVWGIEPKRYLIVPVILSKGNSVVYYETSKRAAQFLAEQLHYCFSTMQRRLNRRDAKIGEWSVTYLIGDVDWDMHGLNLEAKRQKRAWRSKIESEATI